MGFFPTTFYLDLATRADRSSSVQCCSRRPAVLIHGRGVVGNPFFASVGLMRVLLISANTEKIPDSGVSDRPRSGRGGGRDAQARRRSDRPLLCGGPPRARRRRDRGFAPDAIGISLRNLDNSAYRRILYIEAITR